MTNDKQSIAIKIKALLSKTVENGATEDEAMASVAKALELMDKYQVDMTEVETKAEGFKYVGITIADYYYQMIAKRLSSAIGQLANCKVVIWNKNEVRFYGFTSDTQFAEWAFKHLSDYMINGAFAYRKQEIKNGSQLTPRILGKSFVLGAIDRISERLLMEAELRKQRNTPAPGTSLVIVDRRKLMLHEFAKLNMRLGRINFGGTGRVGDGAFGAGQSHGNNATWSRPINNGSEVRRIK